MRGRLALGVVTILALVLGFSSLGLSRPPHSRTGQIVPPTDTPTPTVSPATNTPTSTATTGAPSNTPTSTVTSVPPGPSNTPVASPPAGGSTPRAPGAPATPSTGIKTNACARVVGAQGLILGDAPGFGANHVQIVGRDDVVFVTQGPQRADGLWWWKVTTRDNAVGWGINDQILPYAGECFGVTGEAGATASAPTPLPAQAAGATATAAPSDQSQLPATGANSSGLILAGLLVIVLLVVGLVRRGSQGTV